MSFKTIIYAKSVTPVSGVVSFNTPKFHGELISIHVSPDTSSTTWKMSITGCNGHKLYESRQGGVGEEGDLNQAHGADIINEIMTVAISSATNDENFDIEIRIKAFQL